MKKKMLTMAWVILLSFFVSFMPRVNAESTVSNPVRTWDEDGYANQDCIVTWDCIYFGNYPQSDETGETKDKIKWQVLSVDEEGVALLMATQNLDVYSYDTEADAVTWENSGVRNWLNGTFLNNAFTSEEQAAIAKNNEYQDSVFLLSKEEACNGKYGLDVGTSTYSSNNSRIRTNTAYVAAGGSIESESVNDAGAQNGWWLRTVDEDGNCLYVDESGSIELNGAVADSLSKAICPVLYLDLSNSTVWEKADSLSRESDVFFSEWSTENCGKVHFGWNLDMTCYVWGVDSDAVGHVVIPEQVEWEGNCYTVTELLLDVGFKYCEDMTSITIPNSITSIPVDAFSGCDEELIICGQEGSLAESFAAEKGYQFTTDDSALIPNAIVKDGIHYLLINSKQEAYANWNDEEWISDNGGVVEIASSVSYDGKNYEVTKVLNNTFCYCVALKEITLPNSITKLEGCFIGCEALEKITLPEGLTYIGWSTFDDCSNLMEISFPSTLETIDGGAFSNCSSLTSVIIPKSVKNINMYAFSGCNNLEKVIVNNPDAVIGTEAFSGDVVIYGYKNSTAEDYAIEYGLAFQALDVSHSFSTEWTIDKEATCTIPGSKSHHCTDKECKEKKDVTEIPATGIHTYDEGVIDKLPSCVDKGSKIYTCSVCQQTKTEEVAETGAHTYGDWEETKAALCDKAGEQVRTCTVCANQETEEIPATGFVKGGEFNKGSNSYTIKTVKGKKGTVVYEGPTKKTKKVKIPKTVKVSGKTYTVTEISDKAFKGNTKITSVTIPEGVTKIGKEAFSGCKNLKTITIKSTKLKTVGKNAIKGINKKATIKVPKKQLSKYKKLFKSSTGYKKTMKIKK